MKFNYQFKSKEETIEKFDRLIEIKNKAISLGYNVSSTIDVDLNNYKINVSVNRKENLN